MKKIFCAIAFSLFFYSSFGQLNLVYNPSFEDTTGCPGNNQQIFMTRHWSGVDSSWNLDSMVHGTGSNFWTPCLEHACANGLYWGCPTNPIFYQNPRTGSAMVQCGWYSSSATYCNFVSNYLQGRLIHPLTIGKSYCVTFYVNMENASNFAINKIGAYLDDGSIDTVALTGGPRRLLYLAQVVDSNVISDTVNWVKVQGSFIAAGTESFITIGVFADTATVTKVQYSASGCYAGYLIDDVSVIASDSSADAGPDVHIATGGDTVQIGVSNGAGMPCYWYVLGGTTPIDSGGSTRVHPAATTSYVVEMDLCGRVTKDTVTVYVGHVNVPIRQLAHLSLYPNPATQALNIEDASGCTLSICNLVGCPLFSAPLPTNKETLDISTLPTGVYLARITDNITGECIIKKLVKE